MSFTRSLLIGCLVAVVTGCGGSGDRGSRKVLQNKGSDTLVNVAQAWAEAFQTVDPNIAIAVSGGGSGTGIAALINGTVDLANSSREMKTSEIELARKNGNEPVEHIVGYDALAVFVHPSNPMSGITIAHLAAIYGEGGKAEKWPDIGVTVPGCRDQEIIRASRQNNSGTYAYFREAILGKGDFKLGSRDMHGSKDVVDLVEDTVCSIGYSGLAYATEHVKMPCVSRGEEQACVYPTSQTAADRTYPISRPLFMYTLGEPTGAVKEYLDWILSDEGQCIIAEKGYAPAHAVDCSAGVAESDAETTTASG